MNPLRVGMIGAGGISRVHVAAWQALGAQIAVYSTADSYRFADEYGIDVVELDEIFASSDIVDIVTPTATHAEYALEAIAAGKPTVCEKPLAMTTSEAIRIARASQKASVPVFPAHVVRYFPEYVVLKRYIDTGRIGTPAILRLSRAGQAPSAGSWFFDERLGGGIVLDQMIHDLDQARWLAGEVRSVYAVQNPVSVAQQAPSVVTAHVTLTHVSGAISYLEGFWGPPGLTFQTSMSVAGSDGFVTYRSPHDGAVSFDTPQSHSGISDYLPPQAFRESPYTTEIRAFARGVTDGIHPGIDLTDGVVAVAMAEAANASIASGQPVSLDEGQILEPVREIEA